MFKVNRLNGTVINKFNMILHAESPRIVMSVISGENVRNGPRRRPKVVWP